MGSKLKQQDVHQNCRNYKKKSFYFVIWGICKIVENTSIALSLPAQELSMFVIQQFSDTFRKRTNKIFVSMLYAHTVKYDNVLHFCLY